jgi:hypothetical protein
LPERKRISNPSNALPADSRTSYGNIFSSYSIMFNERRAFLRRSAAAGNCNLKFDLKGRRLSTEASFLPPSTRVCAEGETPKSLISPLEDASNSVLNGIERHDYPSRLFQNRFSSFLRMQIPTESLFHFKIRTNRCSLLIPQT